MKINKKKWSKPILKTLSFKKTMGGWQPSDAEDIIFDTYNVDS
jgi:hypothetical protein